MFYVVVVSFILAHADLTCSKGRKAVTGAIRLAYQRIIFTFSVTEIGIKNLTELSLRTARLMHFRSRGCCASIYYYYSLFRHLHKGAASLFNAVLCSMAIDLVFSHSFRGTIRFRWKRSHLQSYIELSTCRALYVL